MNNAAWIDQLYAFSKMVDFRLSGTTVMCMNLAVGIREANVVPVDEGEGSNARPRKGFGCPGTNTAYTNDRKMCFLKILEFF